MIVYTNTLSMASTSKGPVPTPAPASAPAPAPASTPAPAKTVATAKSRVDNNNCYFGVDGVTKTSNVYKLFISYLLNNVLKDCANASDKGTLARECINADLKELNLTSYQFNPIVLLGTLYLAINHKRIFGVTGSDRNDAIFKCIVDAKKNNVFGKILDHVILSDNSGKVIDWKTTDSSPYFLADSGSMDKYLFNNIFDKIGNIKLPSDLLNNELLNNLTVKTDKITNLIDELYDWVLKGLISNLRTGEINDRALVNKLYYSQMHKLMPTDIAKNMVKFFYTCKLINDSWFAANKQKLVHFAVYLLHSGYMTGFDNTCTKLLCDKWESLLKDMLLDTLDIGTELDTLKKLIPQLNTNVPLDPSQNSITEYCKIYNMYYKLLSRDDFVKAAQNLAPADFMLLSGIDPGNANIQDIDKALRFTHGGSVTPEQNMKAFTDAMNDIKNDIAAAYTPPTGVPIMQLTRSVQQQIVDSLERRMLRHIANYNQNHNQIEQIKYVVLHFGWKGINAVTLALDENTLFSTIVTLLSQHLKLKLPLQMEFINELTKEMTNYVANYNSSNAENQIFTNVSTIRQNFQKLQHLKTLSTSKIVCTKQSTTELLSVILSCNNQMDILRKLIKKHNKYSKISSSITGVIYPFGDVNTFLTPPGIVQLPVAFDIILPSNSGLSDPQGNPIPPNPDILLQHYEDFTSASSPKSYAANTTLSQTIAADLQAYWNDSILYRVIPFFQKSSKTEYFKSTVQEAIEKLLSAHNNTVTHDTTRKFNFKIFSDTTPHSGSIPQTEFDVLTIPEIILYARAMWASNLTLFSSKRDKLMLYFNAETSLDQSTAFNNLGYMHQLIKYINTEDSASRLARLINDQKYLGQRALNDTTKLALPAAGGTPTLESLIYANVYDIVRSAYVYHVHCLLMGDCDKYNSDTYKYLDGVDILVKGLHAVMDSILFEIIFKLDTLINNQHPLSSIPLLNYVESILMDPQAHFITNAEITRDSLGNITKITKTANNERLFNTIESEVGTELTQLLTKAGVPADVMQNMNTQMNTQNLIFMRTCMKSISMYLCESIRLARISHTDCIITPIELGMPYPYSSSDYYVPPFAHNDEVATPFYNQISFVELFQNLIICPELHNNMFTLDYPKIKEFSAPFAPLDDTSKRVANLPTPKNGSALNKWYDASVYSPIAQFSGPPDVIPLVPRFLITKAFDNQPLKEPFECVTFNDLVPILQSTAYIGPAMEKLVTLPSGKTRGGLMQNQLDSLGTEGESIISNLNVKKLTDKSNNTLYCIYIYVILGVLSVTSDILDNFDVRYFKDNANITIVQEGELKPAMPESSTATPPAETSEAIKKTLEEMLKEFAEKYKLGNMITRDTLKELINEMARHDAVPSTTQDNLWHLYLGTAEENLQRKDTGKGMERASDMLDMVTQHVISVDHDGNFLYQNQKYSPPQGDDDTCYSTGIKNTYCDKFKNLFITSQKRPTLTGEIIEELNANLPDKITSHDIIKIHPIIAYKILDSFGFQTYKTPTTMYEQIEKFESVDDWAPRFMASLSSKPDKFDVRASGKVITFLHHLVKYVNGNPDIMRSKPSQKQERTEASTFAVRNKLKAYPSRSIYTRDVSKRDAILQLASNAKLAHHMKHLTDSLNVPFPFKVPIIMAGGKRVDTKRMVGGGDGGGIALKRILTDLISELKKRGKTLSETDQVQINAYLDKLIGLEGLIKRIILHLTEYRRWLNVLDDKYEYSVTLDKIEKHLEKYKKAVVQQSTLESGMFKVLLELSKELETEAKASRQTPVLPAITEAAEHSKKDDDDKKKREEKRRDRDDKKGPKDAPPLTADTSTAAPAPTPTPAPTQTPAPTPTPAPPTGGPAPSKEIKKPPGTGKPASVTTGAQARP